MAELFVGAAVAVALYGVLQHARRNQLGIRWWQWPLVVLGFLFLVLVLEVIVSFLREGSPKAAVVNGAILGFVAIVWAVLLARLVFTKRAVRE